MTTTLVYGASADGRLICTSASYATARDGGGSFTTSPGENVLPYGQSYNGSTYSVAQAFMEFAHVLPAGHVVTSAQFDTYHVTVTGTSVARNMEVRQYNWGGTVESADFRSAAQLGFLPLLAQATGTQGAVGKYVAPGSAALVDLLNAGSSTVRVVVASSRQRLSATPTADEVCWFGSAEASGTATDPVLRFTSVARSELFGVMAAQVRMPDGAWALLESDGAAVPTVLLRRHDGTTVTTLATLPVGTGSTQFAAPDGAQSLALVVDGPDRLFVVGRAGDAANSLAVVGYQHAGGVWTPSTVRQVALPAHAGRVNAVAADTTQGSSSISDLFVLAGHGPGTLASGGTAADLAYARISGYELLVGGGAVSIETGSAVGTVVPGDLPANYWSAYAADLGTGLDVVTGGGRTGFLTAPSRANLMGNRTAAPLARLDLDAAQRLHHTTAEVFPARDAMTKVRVVPTGGSTVCLVAGDPATDFGVTVHAYQVSGTTWTPLAFPVWLDRESVPSMVAAGTLGTSLLWDATYSATTNNLYVYWISPTDRIIRRTTIDLDTYQALRDSVAVGAAVGGSDTIHAIRIARNTSVGVANLVTVAHGSGSTTYRLDSLNVAPTAPIRGARGNFDATTAALFTWTPTDPDPGDVQTAYEFEIINAGTAAVVVSTGKVTSGTPSRTVAGGTLSNGVNYQWRVRTYDQGDVVSPWSTYGAFSTAAGGSVTITDPATDNPAGVATDDYTVQWSVSGTTQDSYRVRLIRTSDEVIVSDTGWLSGAATSRVVSGMVSDVEYRVQVTVRNAALVESNPGTRLITPSYSSPEVPVVSISDTGEGGYVLISVSNPVTPTDRPLPTHNVVQRREAGQAAWATLGTFPVDGSFRDYTATAGVAYEYRVGAVS